MGIMRVLHPHHGDITLTWDPTDQATVDEAIAGFEDQLAEGKIAFSHDTTTGEDAQIRKFNPEADEILFVRPLQGG